MEEMIVVAEADRTLPLAQLLARYPQLQGKSRSTIWRARQGESVRVRGYYESVVQPDTDFNLHNQTSLSEQAVAAAERLRRWITRRGRPRSDEDRAAGLTNAAADREAVNRVDWAALAEEVVDYLCNQTGKPAWRQTMAGNEDANRNRADYVAVAAFNYARKRFYALVVQ
jgi:hypothetical protein